HVIHRLVRHVVMFGRQFLDGLPALSPAMSAQELAIERGEEPGLRLGEIAQPVSLGGPHVEGLLHQVAGIRLAPRQAEGEAEERRVVRVHQPGKGILAHRFHGNRSPETLFPPAHALAIPKTGRPAARVSIAGLIVRASIPTVRATWPANAPRAPPHPPAPPAPPALPCLSAAPAGAAVV